MSKRSKTLFISGIVLAVLFVLVISTILIIDYVNKPPVVPGAAAENSRIYNYEAERYIKVAYPNEAVIENYGRIAVFPISYQQISEMDINIYAFNEAYQYMEGRPSKFDVIKIKNRTEPAHLTNYTTYKKNLNLAKYLKNGYGIVKIVVNATTFEGKTINRVFRYQFTNLSITTKYSPRNFFIYVTHLKTTKPVGSARVSFYSQDNKLVYNGRTNDKGVLIVENGDVVEKLFREYTYDNRWKIFVRQGDDLSMLEYNYRNQLNLYQSGIYNSSARLEKYYGYVFTPKGLYKKDETVVIKGYIRENKGGNLVIPDNDKFRVKVTAPDGNVVLEKTVTLNDFGSFEADYRLNSDPPLGSYNITVSQEQPSQATPSTRYVTPNITGSFMVESYRPRDFEVAASIGEKNKTYINGNNLPYTIKGTYLYGGFMREAKTKFRIQASPYYFNPTQEALQGFNFTSEQWLESESANITSISNMTNPILHEGQGILDTSGQLTENIQIQIPFHSSATVQINAEVEDSKRQSIVSNASVVVHRGEYYIGYKVDKSFISKDEPMKVKILAANSQGKSMGRRKVEVKVYRLNWESYRQLSADGTYRWNSNRNIQLVKTMNVLTSGNHQNPAEIQFNVDKAGSYYITMVSRDNRGNEIRNFASFWTYGGDYTPWSMNDDQTIELVKDKELYAVGDEAKILVKSPYKQIEALVTVEREGVMQVYRYQLKGTADIVRVPIKPEYSPNVFISVILLQGRIQENYPLDKMRDIYKPTIKYGYTTLYVKKDHKALKVTVLPERNVYEPGNTVNVSVKVNDHLNKGVKSEVAIYVIDEGVLSLISYQTPNPFSAFYSNRSLHVTTSDNRLEVLGQHKYILKGEDAGGGGGEADYRSSLGLSNVSVRKIFKAIAFSNSSVITDSSGYAKVKFKLPDNLTKFRIMAIAVDRNDRCGSTQENITVTKNLIAKPALPRFITLNDSMRAGVVIDNNTNYHGSVEVHVQAKGIELQGSNKTRISLKPHESKEVRFNFTAKKMGTAQFEFIAIMHAGKRYTDVVQWSIPVKINYSRTDIITSSQTDGNNVNVGVTIPENSIPETRELSVTAASTALINLKGSIEYLFGYPYGCLEQKMSKIMPMLLASDIVQEFNIQVNVDYRKLIQTLISELYKYQNRANGGYYIWPERQYQYNVHPSLSLDVLYLLWKAKQGGYKIDNTVFEKTLEFAKNYLAKNNFSTASFSYYSEDYWNSTDVFAFYVLSEYKSADESYIQSLYSKIENMPFYIQAVFAKALHNVNKTKYQGLYTAIANRLKNNIIQKQNIALIEENSGKYDYYRHFYLSDVKTASAILQMLITVDRNNPVIPKLIRGILSKMKNGRWRTTQENMYVFWALTTYFKTYENVQPDFQTEFRTQLNSILKGSFKGREMKVLAARINASGLGNKRFNVNIQKTGRGRLYYTVSTHYVPTDFPEAANNGFTIEKQIFDAETGNQILDGKFQAGKVYRVVLSITTADNRYDVVVDDPLPAGFEAINPRLEASSLSANRSQYGYQSRNYYWWLTGFNRIEMKDDRLVLFANQLGSGSHTYTYFAKATTYGSFNQYPSRIEEMYNPEINGSTAMTRVTVE